MEVVNTMEMFKEVSKPMNETNDCVVRAIAVAFDLPYKEAHTFCRLHLRRPNRSGVQTLTYFKGVDHLSKTTTPYAFNSKFLRHCKHPSKIDCTTDKEVGRTGLYLKKFLNSCDKEATYLVLSSGHAYCVKKGVVYGNPNDHRTYVKVVFKLN